MNTNHLDLLFEKGFISFLTLTIVTLAACSLLTAYANKKIDFYNRRHADRITTNQYLNRTTRFLIWFIGLTIIMKQFKPLSVLGNTVLGASSILAVGVSIASQTTLGNYIAGFFLAVHQPFKIGDVIYLQEKHIAGTVREMTFRHTIIETKTGTLLTIPNTTMNTVMIEDLPKEGYIRPLEFKVAAGTDISRLEKLVNQVLAEKDPDDYRPVKLSVEAFDGRGYTVSFPMYALSLNDYTDEKTRVIPELSSRCRENGIDVL
ncbi:MAG: mechanosensitive ion channel [Solobacterium sp.]|nr:mechanosensitive ion channel [Solobacterium sp.]